MVNFQHYLQELESYNGKPTDPHFLTMMAIANIIDSIVNGNRNDYRDEYFNGYVRDMFEISQALSDSAILLAFPFLRYQDFIFVSSSCTICIWTASLIVRIDLLVVPSSAQTIKIID